jgi:type II secretory pathway pseudopilin PulG
VSRGCGRRGFGALELTGVMTIIAIAACLLLWWGQTALNRSREVACQTNLKQIALALSLYAADNGGRLPVSADAARYVSQVYAKNAQLFICPLDPDAERITSRQEGGWPVATSGGEATPAAKPPPFYSSYFIVPGLATDDPPATIVVGDKEPWHRGSRMAACLDGRATQLPGGVKLPVELEESEQR